jgi:cell division protein FtsA
MAGCEIRSVYASISGSHVQSRNSPGVVAIRDKEVTSGDVERVMDAARAVAVPADQSVLHVLPQEFAIDEQEGIRDPVGMSGVRLETRAHLITCALSARQNLSKCVNRCGLAIDELILAPLASADAVLTPDEKELGICLVDIGAGTTDLAIFTQGSIRHTASLPIAGDLVTNDIAQAFRTPTQYAEEIKVRYACALTQLAGAEETIQVPSVGDRAPRRLARQMLAQVVQSRYEEIFSMVQGEIRRSGYESLIAAGIVLTGGAARMEGVVELAEELFQMPVRVGQPFGVEGLGEVVNNPVHATGVGLLRFGARQFHGNRPRGSLGHSDSPVSRAWSWLRKQF